MLSRLTIAQRVWALSIISICIILTKLVFGIVELREQLLDEHKHNLTNVVSVAHGIISNYHQRSLNGELSKEQAQADAISAVKSLRYQDVEYFWINDMQPKMIMHPIKPQLDGKDLNGVKDPTGKYLFKEFVAKVQSSKFGFVEYYWPKAGSDDPVAKLSFVKGFEPWGWLVGSGVYIDNVDQQYQSALMKQLFTLSIAIACLLAVTIVIGRSIIVPLKTATLAMHDIAEGDGDLTVKLDDSGRDELAQLSDGFNQFAEKIRQVIIQMKAFGIEINLSSTNLADVTVQSRTQIDNSQNETNQVATAVTQLSSTVIEVASNAGEASKIVQSVREQAQSGKKEVADSISTMQQVASAIDGAAQSVASLENDAQNIGKIVVVIKSIAEQTNLLALNAAIEAARAGEQGRGFVVVADEVRVLAQRTQESTTEIEQMIANLQQGSQDVVAVIAQGKTLAEQGVEQSNISGQAFNAITTEIDNIVNMNSQIAAATEEQRVVVDMISENINRINDSFTASLDDATSIANASEKLESLSHELERQLSHFKV